MDLNWLDDQVGRLPKGERAKLRRNQRGEGFWKIAARADVEPHEEPRLELLCYAVAQLGQGQQDFGAALYEADYSKTRLNRLLQAKDPETEGRKAINFLAAQDKSADWTELTDLLRYRNDRARESIARSYYFAQHKDEDE